MSTSNKDTEMEDAVQQGEELPLGEQKLKIVSLLFHISGSLQLC